MGFGAGFDVIKRAPNCTFAQMLEAKRRAYFETNDWLSSHYPSYEEYRKTNYTFDKEEPVDVSRELIDFYKQHEAIEIDDWCSSARYFDDDVRALLKNYGYEYSEIDAQSLDSLITYAQSEVDSMAIEPVVITHGLKMLDHDDDDAEVKLIPVDGVQIQFEDGTVRQIYNEYDYDVVFVSKSLADFEKLHLFESLLNCVKTLKTYDPDEWFLYYWRG